MMYTLFFFTVQGTNFFFSLYISYTRARRGIYEINVRRTWQSSSPDIEGVCTELKLLDYFLARTLITRKLSVSDTQKQRKKKDTHVYATLFFSISFRNGIYNICHASIVRSILSCDLAGSRIFFIVPYNVFFKHQNYILDFSRSS